MSNHTDIVDAYMERFRRSDKPEILALLTDDVAWDLPGFRHLTGKAAFEGEIVNAQFEEYPTLVVDQVEGVDTVVCIGQGHGQMKTGAEIRFAFCDVFTFRGDLICRVESYIVPLTGPSIAELADGVEPGQLDQTSSTSWNGRSGVNSSRVQTRRAHPRRRGLRQPTRGPRHPSSVRPARRSRTPTFAPSVVRGQRVKNLFGADPGRRC